MIIRKKTKEIKPVKELTPEERYSQLERIANVLERMRIGEYVNNFNHPMRIIWLNLLSGIAKGVGLTIGATLVIAIIFKLLSALIAMNIPYLTDVLQDVVQIVKATPGLGNVHSLTTVETHVGDQPVDVVIVEPKETENGTESN
jgi:hypothetical protein